MAAKIVRSMIIVCLFVAVLDLSAHAQTNNVRIALVKDGSEVELSIRGKYEIYDAKRQMLLATDRSLHRTLVKVVPAGIKIGEKVYASRSLKILPSKDVTIYQNGVASRYRGEMDIVSKNGKSILVINQLSLEEYVKGVLYHEVSHKWPMDALKAQAVAVRTYALYQTTANKDTDYDVTGDIYSQVYGGRSAERFRTTIAVNRTQGEVLKYQGKIIPAYFHANCGGHTEDVSQLWNHHLEPLKGVICPYGDGAPHSKWKKNFRSTDIEKILKDNGYTIGPIKEIRVIDLNASGRIKNLMIIDRQDNSIMVPGKKFREIVGPNVIKSNKYTVVMKGYYFDLLGQGWGHGVGMCQWGAYGMSRERFKYDEILKFYYPGAAIVKLPL